MKTLSRGLCLFIPLLLVACGGGGGGSAPPPPPPPVGNVTISGTVTFDKVPFSAAVNGGLDFANTNGNAPVRGATVQAVAAGGQTVLATTTTDASGNYALTVAGNTDLFIRVRAEMVRTGTPSWNFTVRDNTATEALYTLDGPSSSSGAANSTRNLAARSGWTAGSGYTGTRAAAPFAILDAAYQSYQLVLGADANATFPELRMFWSTRNVPCDPAANNFCDGSGAALTRGEIGTTFFTPGSPDRIFVLGSAGTDTDEFDAAVIAHEWGHYYQDNFSRDDSLGGPHTTTERLDLRVAFSEGWGNAFSGMARGDPVYRDSFGTNQASGFGINVENSASLSNAGWFNEGSIQSIFWDLFDSTPDGVDNVALGFGPIHTVMTGRVRTTSAFTSVYPLLAGLRAARPADSAAIDALVVGGSGQLIVAGADDFGSGETNSGLDARNLPIYRSIVAGQTLEVCSSLPTASGVYNKLGNRRLLRIDLASAGTATLTANLGTNTGTSPSDPDLVLYSAGAERTRAEGTANGAETLTQAGLAAGTYILEVYEFSNVDPSATARGNTCFNVQLTVS